jgi:hypothetical protein
MVREGVSDEDIIAVLMNREFKISKHVFEHADPERQAIIWTARARKKAEKTPRPGSNDGRPEIEWGPTSIVPSFYEAEQALIQCGGNEIPRLLAKKAEQKSNWCAKSRAQQLFHCYGLIFCFPF